MVCSIKMCCPIRDTENPEDITQACPEGRSSESDEAQTSEGCSLKSKISWVAITALALGLTGSITYLALENNSFDWNWP